MEHLERFILQIKCSSYNSNSFKRKIRRSSGIGWSFLESASISFNKRKPTVPQELYTLLSTYNFPGNIRELKSMVFDAVSRHKSKIMSLSSFKELISPGNDFVISDVVNNINSKVTFGDKLPTLKEVQNMLVQEALSRTKIIKVLPLNCLVLQDKH